MASATDLDVIILAGAVPFQVEGGELDPHFLTHIHHDDPGDVLVRPVVSRVSGRGQLSGVTHQRTAVHYNAVRTT